MRFPQPLRLADAAEFLGCRYVGDPEHLLLGLNEIHRVEAGDLTFSDVKKYFKKAIESPATTLLLNEAAELPEGKAMLLSDDPFRDYNRLSQRYAPRRPLSTAAAPAHLHPSVRLGQNVVLGHNVRIAENCEIGHNVVIGSDVEMGPGCLIYPNVVIYDNTTIGEGCIVHANATIGSDAFYYKKRPWGREKMHSCGRTVLGNHVEVGAGATIDRGVSAETRIGDFTKIDNLVQVGHEVQIGARCVIAAQVGIAGVSVIGDDAILWGQAGLATESRIGKGAQVMAKSGVMSPVPDGQTHFGYPAREAMRQWRITATLDRVAEHWPEILKLLEARNRP